MMRIDSRENVRTMIAAIASDSAKDPSCPRPDLIARLATTVGVTSGELTRAVGVELRLQKLEETLDLSRLTVSHIRELRRIMPDRGEIIDEVARKAVAGELSVRTVRALVDDSVRGQVSQASTARESSSREAIDFERSAYRFVEMNKKLFTDSRAVLKEQPRGSRIAADFVLYDGTGILVAFECKQARKPPNRRQVVDLVGAHALFSRTVEEYFAVFSTPESGFPETYRQIVDEFELDRQHTLTLDLGAQDNGRCHYRIHRRTPEGWHESGGEGVFARRINQ